MKVLHLFQHKLAMEDIVVKTALMAIGIVLGTTAGIVLGVWLAMCFAEWLVIKIFFDKERK